MKRKLQITVLSLFAITAVVFVACSISPLPLPLPLPSATTSTAPRQLDAFERFLINSSADPPPTECAFQENLQYPAQLPSLSSDEKWRDKDFKTQPMEYLKALLEYGLEGQKLNGNCLISDGSRWFHMREMPGRETRNGLTKERRIKPEELHPQQVDRFNNYAVSVYNGIGGYEIGKFWNNQPQLVKQGVAFPEGTMVIKFLFTEATEDDVPYLKGAPSIVRQRTNGTTAPLSLLQVDVAVRDKRADSATGWVFGTFIFNGDRTPEQGRLVPIGLMYGNRMSDGTDQASESIYNPQAATELPQGYNAFRGEGGRLNGPVDDPSSSCLSCHSTADVPKPGAIRFSHPPPDDLPATLDFYFRNVPAGQTFAAAPFGDPAKYFSMDYSLQFQISVLIYNRKKHNILGVSEQTPLGRDDEPIE
jgi:hypothetical protein